MDQAVVWVDVENAVRSWARDFVLSAERRVFFGVNNNVDFPQIVLHRLGGPDSACLIQFDVWAATKATAAAAAAELASAVDALARYDTGDVLLHAAVVESSRWLPDPETDKPRYIVDVTFVASAASAVIGS